MHDDITPSKKPYRMEFDVGTIKHLGLQMYSTLPPVIAELVANAWDANATKVEITIPEMPIDQSTSKIVISDDGIGMSDTDVRGKYLIIGRDRREKDHSDETASPYKRKIMGRKGIGKFSAFGIAKEIVVESVKDGNVSHFRMNYDELLAEEDKREIEFPPLPPTDTVHQGTKIILKYITKFKNRRIPIGTIRRGLARRFAVIGEQNGFEVIINDEPISIEERNLHHRTRIIRICGNTIRQRLELLSGWIGTLANKLRARYCSQRGKLVQEPFVFDAVVGQQFALSYLIGELHVDFVDEVEDTIATTRNSLVWDTEANTALKEWGQKEVNKTASLWAKKRGEDNERKLQEHPLYLTFQEQAGRIDKKREFKQANQLVRQLIQQSTDKNPTAEIKDFEPMIQMFLDFWKFDSFREMAEDIKNTGIEEPEKLLNLFREWEILEAKEMAKVTEGRITSIKTLQRFIKNNAFEKPTLHDFLKEFPWIIDPHWTLVADEVQYSDLLRNTFPEIDDIPEANRRIDFLCVGEGENLIVVEIKRPNSKVTLKELDQITAYVEFIETCIHGTSDPDHRYKEVKGYLLCGDLVNRDQVKVRQRRLAQTKIYVRRYIDLLAAVERSHSEFLKRYDELQEAKQMAENRSDS